MVHETFDMVVLSVGLQVSESSMELARALDIELNHYNFAKTETFAPVETSRPGVYACGILQGPKDIPSSVTEASAAAAAASIDVAEARGQDLKVIQLPDAIDVLDQEPRIGVFVCNCGINIAGVVDVPDVEAYSATYPMWFTPPTTFSPAARTPRRR